MNLARDASAFLFPRRSKTCRQSTQLLAGGSDLLLSPPAFGDVDARSIPSNDVSCVIAQRGGANQEPAIFPVGPPQAHFILGGLPRSHVRAPLFHDPWKVFGMDCERRLFNVLLQREARIVQRTPIDEINDAVRPNAPGHPGDYVDEKAKVVFASSQCTFSPPALCNLLAQFFVGRHKLP